MAVVGDVGEGEAEDWQTAWAIRQLAFEDAPYDALLLLGDNVYPRGDPSRLEHTVFRPFTIVLETGAELFAIVGNHDAPHADEQMEILGMPATWWTMDLGDVRLIGLDSNRVGDPDQLAFLERTLRSADEPWRIVAVHEPPYSAGYQGSSRAARETFGPLFERYGVQLVLSGHEHDYQRSVPIRGVTYVISGAGGRTRGTGEASFTAASWAVLHFTDVNVYADHILLRAVDQDARMFDQVEIPLGPAP
jgi:3',5'-cyclic AMP phosphodiesterase CpdA